MKIGCYKNKTSRQVLLSFDEKEVQSNGLLLPKGWRATILKGRVIHLIPDDKGWIHVSERGPGVYTGSTKQGLPLFGMTHLKEGEDYQFNGDGLTFTAPTTPLRNVSAEQRKTTNAANRVKKLETASVQDLRKLREGLENQIGQLFFIAESLGVEVNITKEGKIEFTF